MLDRFRLLCLVALLAGGCSANAWGQIRFDGGGDGTSWTDDQNWTGNEAPSSAADDASINTGDAWDVIFSGSTTNIGQLTVGTDDTLTLNARINASSLGSNTGQITVNSGGFLQISNTWGNAGILTVNENGPIGTAGAATSMTNASTGTLQGESFLNPFGFIANTVINNGTIAPGFSENDAAGLGFASDLVLGSTSILDIEIGGNTTAQSFDYISVALDVVLGGELQLTMFNDFVPGADQAYTIVDATTIDGITGSFTNVLNGQRLTTTDGSGSWLVSYGANSQFGNADVRISDFRIVPEPQSLAILLVGGFALCRRRR